MKKINGDSWAAGSPHVPRDLPGIRSRIRSRIRPATWPRIGP